MAINNTVPQGANLGLPRNKTANKHVKMGSTSHLEFHEPKVLYTFVVFSKMRKKGIQVFLTCFAISWVAPWISQRDKA